MFPSRNVRSDTTGENKGAGEAGQRSRESRRPNRGVPPDVGERSSNSQSARHVIHFIFDHSRLSTPYEFGASSRPGIVIDDITHGEAAHRLHATRGVTAWELLAVPPRCLPLRRRVRGRRHRCRHRRRPRRPRSAGSRRRCGSSGRTLNSRRDRDRTLRLKNL